MSVKTEILKSVQDVEQLQLMMASEVQRICILPLEEYLEKANLAESIGPIIDPTLYMKAGKSMSEWMELAKDLNKIKEKYKGKVFGD